MTSIVNKNIENIIQNNMMEFSAYVLLDRALPDLRDGMKPVHRRILYSMFLMKAFKFVKSANVVGSVMKLHPHGSSYSTMVGMVQKDNQLIPLLEGKGNFANHTSRDLEPAADRYSEVKLSDISIDMMKDFDKNLVEFISNYDGTMKMPSVLPVKFPSILAYVNSGIGVGFSSSIPSFNLNELCNAIIKYIKTNKKTILVPDFATGGLIIKNEKSFKDINETGLGSIQIRGKAEIDGNEILIHEIPYSTTREAIIEKIIELNKAGKLKEVTDVKDLTGLKGLLIAVTARRGTDMDLLLEKLYKFTPLQSSFSVNMNMLVDDLLKVMGVWQTIDKWLIWRTECIKRGLNYDIKKMSEKLHILKGLEKVLLDIDAAIDIIRNSPEEMIEFNLQTRFDIDLEQAKEVANMKLRNINQDYIIKKIKDIKKLEETIEEYKSIINDHSKLNNIIIKDLKEIKKKYGQDRRSQIIELTNVKPIKLVEEVPDYPVTIFLTKEGYCFKFKGNQKPVLKPGDSVIKTFETNNKGQILAFCSDAVCYKIALNDIEETRANNLGTYLPNLTKDKNINIINYSVLDDKHKFIIYLYTNNRIAKIKLEAFDGTKSVLRNSFCSKQELFDLITLEDDITLNVTTDKKKIKVNTKDYGFVGQRNATGQYMSSARKLKKVEVI